MHAIGQQNVVLSSVIILFGFEIHYKAIVSLLRGLRNVNYNMYIKYRWKYQATVLYRRKPLLGVYCNWMLLLLYADTGFMLRS